MKVGDTVRVMGFGLCVIVSLQMWSVTVSHNGENVTVGYRAILGVQE